MKKRFDGTIDELKDIVRDHNIAGEWDERDDQHLFRTSGGAMLHWWTKSRNKTIHYDGPELAIKELEDKLGDIFTGGHNTGIPSWFTDLVTNVNNKPRLYVYFGKELGRNFDECFKLNRHSSDFYELKAALINNQEQVTPSLVKTVNDWLLKYHPNYLIHIPPCNRTDFATGIVESLIYYRILEE